jgi:V/A-type H+-transporting ATPase subunit B
LSIDLIKRQWRTISSITGPLIFVERLTGGSLGEMCVVELADGEKRTGQILQLMGTTAIVQVLQGTSGIDPEASRVLPTGETARIGVSKELFGRVLNGFGEPIDGLPPIIPDEYLDINGLPMNPASRDKPDFFVQTGISAIDGLNTLVRGQKLPIFSGAGLPAKELALQIVRQAKVSEAADFAVILGAMGITPRGRAFFSGSLCRRRARSTVP